MPGTISAYDIMALSGLSAARSLCTRRGEQASSLWNVGDAQASETLPIDNRMAEITRPDAERLGQVHQLLLDWYERVGRKLPWRETTDPYAILVSEMMLQQTQVDRVLPKYREFLERFPTLAALAEAPTAEVIRAWAPLGYNMRAVRLQAIARQVVADYGGQIPASVPELLALKGVGRYTAGA